MELGAGIPILHQLLALVKVTARQLDMLALNQQVNDRVTYKALIIYQQQ